MSIGPQRFTYLKSLVQARLDAFHVEDRDRCTKELADAAEDLIREIERLRASSGSESSRTPR